MTPTGEEYYVKWASLKKYFQDFGRLWKKNVPNLILWEKYLVFATVFGVAEKIVKEFELPAEIRANTGSMSSGLYAFSGPRFLRFVLQ